MPTGPYTLREKANDFKRTIDYSKQSIQWLKYVMKIENIHIRHAENSPHGEKRIENFFVDGFCSENNTVYEFLGCYLHGHCVHHGPFATCFSPIFLFSSSQNNKL